MVGVEPDAEARALARQLEERGYRVERELRGQHFTALFAVDTERRPARVRVVTRRGVALALDAAAGHALQPGVSYTLLAPPSAETHDADGDGFEEVFVEELPERGAACILIFRVRDSGFVDPVPSSGYALSPGPHAPPWDAPQFCADPEPPDAGAAEQPAGAAAPDAGSPAPR